MLPCPSLSPGVCSNPCPLSRWCLPTISSFVAPFSACPQSSPESESLPMSWLFVSCGQRIGASASVLPMNIQDWFPLGWTGWISLQTKGLSESSPAPQFESINSSVLSLLYGPTLTFVSKVMSLLFNTQSRFVTGDNQSFRLSSCPFPLLSRQQKQATSMPVHWLLSALSCLMEVWLTCQVPQLWPHPVVCL